MQRFARPRMPQLVEAGTPHEAQAAALVHERSPELGIAPERFGSVLVVLDHVRFCVHRRYLLPVAMASAATSWAALKSWCDIGPMSAGQPGKAGRGVPISTVHIR